MMKTYLFEYGHQNNRWIIEIKADDPADAWRRVWALSSAAYIGELQMKIPARMGWLAKIVCWIRNTIKPEPPE